MSKSRSARQQARARRKEARKSRHEALRSLPVSLVPLPTLQPRVRFPVDAPRIRLKVPYEWKEHAKALGARWDADLKTWWTYSLAGMDVDYLELWLVDGEIELLPKIPASKRGSLKAVAKDGCGVIAEFSPDQPDPKAKDWRDYDPKPRTTDSPGFVEHKSNALPWEECGDVPADWMQRRHAYMAEFNPQPEVRSEAAIEAV
jgi:hypothetical protein